MARFSRNEIRSALDSAAVAAKPVHIRQAVLGGSDWAYVCKAGGLTEDARMAAGFRDATAAHTFAQTMGIKKYHVVRG